MRSELRQSPRQPAFYSCRRLGMYLRPSANSQARRSTVPPSPGRSSPAPLWPPAPQPTLHLSGLKEHGHMHSQDSLTALGVVSGLAMELDPLCMMEETPAGTHLLVQAPGPPRGMQNPAPQACPLPGPPSPHLQRQPAGPRWTGLLWILPWPTPGSSSQGSPLWASLALAQLGLRD